MATMENDNPWPLRLKLILFVIVTLIFIGGATGVFAQERQYDLDPEHTTVGFLVSHIGYAKTLGVFTEVEGEFTFDPEALTLSSGEVRVQTASVETFNDARDNHVRSADFLDAGAHPTMTFRLTEARATGESTGVLIGDLTLRGQTHPIELDVTLNRIADYPFGHERETVGISARGTIDRSTWGMTYGVPAMVGDAVELIIEAEAILAQ